MAQKIKVQDGNIVYAASDPAYDINFNIKGLLTVDKSMQVGDATVITPGLITTNLDPVLHRGQNLTITTASGSVSSGNLYLSPTGSLLLSGKIWPSIAAPAQQGSYLGASSTDALEFYPFVYDVAYSNNLTPDSNPSTGLNFLYPGIQPGQCVIGPQVVYQCVALATWRIEATKQYVDTIAAGINIHGACEASTTSASNLSTNTYTNGVSGPSPDTGLGVGAYLQGTPATAVLGTIGGYAGLGVGSRVLVKDQSNHVQNGVYVVSTLGDGISVPWKLTRASDYDNSTYGGVTAGDAVYVQEGTLGGTQWIQTSLGTQSPGDCTKVGTDPIIFSQFSGAGSALGTTIPLGDSSMLPLTGAYTMPYSTFITTAIADLNTTLGLLVPAGPPTFPNSVTLAIQSLLGPFRMANFAQTDHTGDSHSVAGGTSLSVLRSSLYITNTITNVGPGNSGLVSAVVNGSTSGSVTLTGSSNGAYGSLLIAANGDYHNVNPSTAAGFYYSFSASASGSVVSGWNKVAITDTSGSPTSTNVPFWYYDSSAPGVPVVSGTIVPPGSPSYTYSSTVPHYNSSTSFVISALANRLSGDMYPVSDTFITGSAGGAFNAPASVTYAGASVTTPLARNLYVASGNAIVPTTASIITGFGSSAGSCSLSCDNSYSTGSGNLSPGATVLYKTGTSNAMEETNITFGTPVGSGAGLAFRIINPGSTNTPVYTGTEAAFNSQSSTLQTYDATMVAGILKNDVTNYATGYLPVGPNLSSHAATQYFTFKFVRTSTSKFDIKFTGTVAGMWVALPGSVIDASSTLNGWLDMTIAYAGAGYPGVNPPGNLSNGCAIGGPVVINTAQTNYSKTCTFGTVSSSSTATNEIYVRIALTAGQTISALSLQTASN